MTPYEWKRMLTTTKAIACKDYLGIKEDEFDQYDPWHRDAQNAVISQILIEGQIKPSSHWQSIKRSLMAILIASLGYFIAVFLVTLCTGIFWGISSREMLLRGSPWSMFAYIVIFGAPAVILPIIAYLAFSREK